VAARPAPRRDVPDPPDARGIEVAIGYGQFLDDSSPGEGRPWLLDLSFTLVIPVWRPADWLRIEAAPGVSFAYGRTPAGGERRDRVLGTFEIGPRLLFGRRGGVSLAAFWPATLIADSDGAEPSLDGWGVRAGLFVHRRVALVGEYRRVDREGESLRSIQAALTWWVD